MAGGKNWVQHIAVGGRRREIGLGAFPLVTLREARDAAFENARLARGGGDPFEGRTRRAAPMFAEAVAAVIGMHAAAWKDGGKSARQWESSLRDYAFPRIGGKRVDAVTGADVMAVLLPIWNKKHETARRVKQRISATMKWAVAQSHRADNPVDGIDEALPRPTARPRHHRALPYAEVADAVDRVRRSNAGMATRLGFEFLVLTTARSGEVRLATWDEMDTDDATWTLPASRMKAKREHRVPLAGRALEILCEARTLDDGSGLVFPSPRGGRPMSDRTLSAPLRDLGIDAVPHGFRSSFRDWAAERTNTPHAVMEAALAHVIPNKAEAAYARSDLFDKRRRLMEAWDRYIGDAAAQVVALDGTRLT